MHTHADIDCADWQRVMHPPRGEQGGPKSVRVCDACFRPGLTFDFHPSPTSHNRSLRTLRRQNSDECLVSRDAGTMHQPAATNQGSFRSVRRIRSIASAPCLQSLDAPPASLSGGGRVAAGHVPTEGGHSRRSSDEPAGIHPSDDECSSSDTVVSKPCAPVPLDVSSYPSLCRNILPYDCLRTSMRLTLKCNCSEALRRGYHAAVYCCGQGYGAEERLAP